MNHARKMSGGNSGTVSTGLPDWKGLSEASKPLLEWMVQNEEVVGPQLADDARRILVRMYMASMPRPGLAKPAS